MEEGGGGVGRRTKEERGEREGREEKEGRERAGGGCAIIESFLTGCAEVGRHRHLPANSNNQIMSRQIFTINN